MSAPAAIPVQSGSRTSRGLPAPRVQGVTVTEMKTLEEEEEACAEDGLTVVGTEDRFEDFVGL